MNNSRLSLSFPSLFLLLILLVLHLQLLFSVSTGQLAPSETRFLFQVQKLLEHPRVLEGWTNWTNLCYPPPSPSLNIVCSNGHVTELSIVGNKTSPSPNQTTLSTNFSIDAFFTLLTMFANLKVLSLVSLCLWGPLPAKINGFWSLQLLNLSSNSIYGHIPQEIASLKNLTRLVLAHDMLNGTIPDLTSLLLLEELNLAGNHLGPSFPWLGNNLVIIILKNNSLRSFNPTGIKKFNKLQQLDMSSNKIIGPIPTALFSLPSLQYLDLAQNQFGGPLPSNTSCGVKLKFVDISHNLLIGELPSYMALASNSSNRTIISSWNCLLSAGKNSTYQHPYAFCHKEALAVKPPETSDDQDHKSSTIKLGIVGGVLGIVGVLVSLILLAIIRRRSETTAADHDHAHSKSKRSVRSTIDSRRVPQTMRSAAIGLPHYRVFTLEEMEDATNNFDPLNLIADGSKGQLYKGWLGDGSVVLVKCVKLRQKHLRHSLIQQIEVLSKLRHLHLVSILGHTIVTYQDNSSTTSTVFVVLEHFSNGSLRDYLADERKKEALKWPQRMAITIGVARGIQFLHTGVAPGIFGNDVKIEHVLLDDSLTAKLSNYSIPLPSKVGSESPLNGQDVNNIVSSETAEKEDVYQFGVILLQVITGKLVTSNREVEERKVELEKWLSSEAPSKLQGLVVDPCTRGTFAYESLKTAAEITISCLNRASSNRPSIEDVLWNLQYSIQIQDGWSSSGNLDGPHLPSYLIK